MNGSRRKDIDGRGKFQELMLYLLQLVQALKFGRPSSTLSPSSSLRHSRHVSITRLPANLEDFLIERSVSNPVLGNHFHWYIAVESEDKTYGGMFLEVAKKFDRRISEVSLPSPILEPRSDGKYEDRLRGNQISIVEIFSFVRESLSLGFLASRKTYACRKTHVRRRLIDSVPSSTTRKLL